MGNIFLNLLNISITATWFIIAVIIFRVVFKKVPKSVNCILWCLVILRLVLPFSIESPFSFIGNTTPVKSSQFYIESTESVAPQKSGNAEVVGNSASDDLVAVKPENKKTIDLTEIISVIWVSGSGVMFLYALLSYIKIRNKVKERLPYQKSVYLCENISTPFILGVIKPEIYIPVSISEEDALFVIKHEKTHLKRLDHLLKPLGFLVLSVYWFNPAIWVLYILLCRDIELACDEKVIKELGEENKKAYSNTLIDCSAERKIITACPLAFGETSVKTRVKSILKYKKPAIWLIIISLIVTLILTVGFLTNPETKFQNIINEKGYTILKQEESGLSISIPHHEITESVFNTERVFEKNEVIVYSDDFTVVYLKSIRPDLEALEFCYEFSYKELPDVGKVKTSLTKNNKNCLYVPDDYIHTSDSLLEITPRLRTNDDGSFSLTIPMDVCKQMADADDKFFVQIGCNAVYYKKDSLSEAEVSYFDGVFKHEESLFMATELIYDCGVFSSVPAAEWQPYYIVSGDMYISELDRETEIVSPRVKLEKSSLEDYESFFVESVWYIDGYSFEKLVKDNKNTWVYKEEDKGEIILLLEQKNGSLYIASGYYGGDSTLEEGFFRDVFDLTSLTGVPSFSEYPLPYNNIEDRTSKAEVDIDDDGEKELCLIYSGPTSGVLSCTIVVQELGAKSLLEDGVYTVYYTLGLPSFVEGENGGLFVSAFDDELLKVTVDKELNEVVLLDENGEVYSTQYLLR